MSSSAATTYFDNAASTGRERGNVPRTELAMRETGSGAQAGFLMLVPPRVPRYLLVPNFSGQELQVHDLLRPDSPGVAVVNGVYVYSAAVSADGGSIFLGCNSMNGKAGDLNASGDGLRLYDTAQLLEAAVALLDGGQFNADDQVAPRALGPNIAGQTECAGAAFSQDSTRLFVLWKMASAITVHDPSHPELQVMRTLPFSGANFQYDNFQLACAGGLVAACGGGGAGSSALPSSLEEAQTRRQVKLWRVDGDRETDLWTASQPDEANSVAIRPDGGLLAVGLRNGLVRLLSPVASGGMGGEHGEPVELEPMETVSGDPMVSALCFSHDGARLVAGRGSDDFVVYDVASAAVVARFVHPKTQGWSVAFFPAGDVLVTGGSHVQPCVFHRLLSPIPRVDLSLSSSADVTSSDIVSNDELGSVVAMASGSQLEVHTEGRKVLLQQDVGEQMFTSLSNFRTVVRLHPSGKFVACVLAKKAVLVLSIADGSEVLRFSDTNGSTMGVFWSQDGSLLAVPCGGVRVFSVDAGFAQVQHVAAGALVFGMAFDSTSTRMAVGTMDNRLTVWDVATWKPTRKFQTKGMIFSICFSHNADRLAYWELADHAVVVLSLEAEADAPQCVVKHVNAATAMMFSPDDSCLLCCPSAHLMFDETLMRVLDLTTGADSEWGALLRTMALPVTGGVLFGRTLGWKQLARAHALTPDTTGHAWVLYGAVGHRFVAVDVQAALHAIHDNAWSVDQLTFCVANQQEHVRSIVEAAAHCSNIRDVETGETVLHRLARTTNPDLMEKWLEKCSQVTPVANAQGQTAAQLAMQLEHADRAQALWSKLNLSTISVSASLVMQELRALSNTHAHQVRNFLLEVEPKVAKTLATFRTELTRSVEVCGLPTATLAGSRSDGETQSEQENATENIPSIWADKCPADSPKTLVASRVVVLPDLLGDANSSPLHAIVTHCDASVFESKLLQLIVQHKWEENVRSQRLRSIALYGFALIIGALAMITSVTNVVPIALSTVDMLQGLVVIIEVSSLGVEAFELAREGCGTYFTGPWNILDIVSSGLLLFGSASHFLGAMDGVRTAGALGVALKCFGMVDYLRSSPATGSLVRMISVILTDMIPFMTILLFAMLGCMLFFTINLSSSLDVDPDNNLSLFRTLVTVYHMTLGIGAGIDIQDASIMTVVVVTLFMSFVVVVLLNLLIAIMGDSYEKVKEGERVEAIRERARIIVEEEKRFPNSHRYHRFMHYVEAVDSTENSEDMVWEGVTNRVGQMLSLEVGRLEQNQQELHGKITELNLLNTQLNGKIDNRFSEVHSKIDDKFSEVDSRFELLELKLGKILDALR